MARALVLRMSVAFAITAGLAKAVIACVDLDSLGNGPVDAAAVPPPGKDAEPPPVIPDPCTHDRLDEKSAVDDSTDGGDLPAFTMALDTVDLDPQKVRALDLDGVCTCDTRPGSLAKGGASCTGNTVTCDGDGGTDNNLGTVAQASQSIIGIANTSNRLVAAGHRTLLIQVEKYNGLANDSEVVVATIIGLGIRAKGCPTSVEDDAGYWTAGRCGDDAWTLSPASGFPLSGGLKPYVIGTGYVRDYRLVVRLGAAAQIPFNDQTTIAFRTPIISGRLVPLGEDLMPRDVARAPTAREKRLFRMEDAVLNGRVLASDALATLGTYQQGATGTRLCNSAGFGLVRDSICNAADILGKDTTEPETRCDALSAAIGFVAIPVLQSYVSDAGPLPSGCESVDAAIFTCP